MMQNATLSDRCTVAPGRERLQDGLPSESRLDVKMPPERRKYSSLPGSRSASCLLVKPAFHRFGKGK